MDTSTIKFHYWEKSVDSLIVAGILLLLFITARSLLNGNVKDRQSRALWQKAINYTGLLTAFVLIGCVWVAAIRPVVIVIGILAAAVTMTHKAALMNLTGGRFIAWRSLFSIGDRIQVGAHRGDVIGTGPFYFTLFEVGDTTAGHQSTGRILKIPNHLILSTPIANHSKFFPHVWHELTIVLQPDTNWVKAKAIFQQLTEKHTKAYEGSARAAIQNAGKRSPIIRNKTGPRIYVSLQHTTPAGIGLTSRFLCEARAIRDTEVLIYEDLLNRLKKEPDIQLAFEIAPKRQAVEKPHSPV